MQTKMLDAGVLSGTSSPIARKAGFREIAREIEASGFVKRLYEK